MIAALAIKLQGSSCSFFALLIVYHSTHTERHVHGGCLLSVLLGVRLSPQCHCRAESCQSVLRVRTTARPQRLGAVQKLASSCLIVFRCLTSNLKLSPLNSLPHKLPSTAVAYFYCCKVRCEKEKSLIYSLSLLSFHPSISS